MLTNPTTQPYFLIRSYLRGQTYSVHGRAARTTDITWTRQMRVNLQLPTTLQNLGTGKAPSRTSRRRTSNSATIAPKGCARFPGDIL